MVLICGGAVLSGTAPSDPLYLQQSNGRLIFHVPRSWKSRAESPSDSAKLSLGHWNQEQAVRRGENSSVDHHLRRPRAILKNRSKTAIYRSFR